MERLKDRLLSERQIDVCYLSKIDIYPTNHRWDLDTGVSHLPYNVRFLVIKGKIHHIRTDLFSNED